MGIESLASKLPHSIGMPTIGTKPSLEATQAVGAVLLHKFARERFVEAGIDVSLVEAAEDTIRLNELAETLLHEEAPNLTNTSLEVLNNTNESTSLRSDNLSQNNINSTQNTSASTLNGSSVLVANHGEENFHSIMGDETMGPNGTTMQQDRTVYLSMNTSNRSTSAFDRLQASPSLASYGKELRRIAEEFEKSRLRQTVKERACQVNISDITKESFVKLLEELFQEKVTREKIVILFFFCTDVALQAASLAQDLVIKLLSWSFSFIINTVCSFIHKLGGWDKVLFYQLPSILVTCCAALAICSLVVYLKKNLLRGS